MKKTETFIASLKRRYYHQMQVSLVVAEAEGIQKVIVAAAAEVVRFRQKHFPHQILEMLSLAVQVHQSRHFLHFLHQTHLLFLQLFQMLSQEMMQRMSQKVRSNRTKHPRQRQLDFQIQPLS